MNTIFLGPPGSGKGTQAQQLSREFGSLHLSTGDMFREAIKNETPVGLELKSYVENGKLVPDELVSRLVFEKLNNLKNAAGVLMDGYPRTLDQAKAFDDFSKKNQFIIDGIVFFDVPSDELVKRLSARRQCGACKEVFNLVTKPPKVEGVCDKCGKSLIHRNDDKEEVVKERLQVYENQTAPLLEFYQGRNGFHKIDANRAIGEVYGDLKKAVSSVKA